MLSCSKRATRLDALLQLVSAHFANPVPSLFHVLWIFFKLLDNLNDSHFNTHTLLYNPNTTSNSYSDNLTKQRWRIT